jgi:hypothetical protein
VVGDQEQEQLERLRRKSDRLTLAQEQALDGLEPEAGEVIGADVPVR